MNTSVLDPRDYELVSLPGPRTMDASSVGVDRVEVIVQTTLEAIEDALREAAEASGDEIVVGCGARLEGTLRKKNSDQADDEIILVISVPRAEWKRLRGPEIWGRPAVQPELCTSATWLEAGRPASVRPTDRSPGLEAWDGRPGRWAPKKGGG